MTKKTDHTAKLNKVDALYKEPYDILLSDIKRKQNTKKIQTNPTHFSRLQQDYDISRDPRVQPVKKLTKSDQLQHDIIYLDIPRNPFSQPENKYSNLNHSSQLQQDINYDDMPRDPRPQPTKNHTNSNHASQLQQYINYNDMPRDPQILRNYRTVTCKYWLKNQCKFGDECRFAHFLIENDNRRQHSYDHSNFYVRRTIKQPIHQKKRISYIYTFHDETYNYTRNRF